MTVYLDLVVILNFAVDFLLLFSTKRLCGFPIGWARTAVSAMIGGLYAGVCMIPGFTFLGNSFWRLVFLVLMSIIAFGMNSCAIRAGSIFVLLSMALGGVALGMGQYGFWGLFASLAVLCGICTLGFRGKLAGKQFVKTVIRYRGREIKLMALKDTGNLLKDPISGEAVTVVGADIARILLGIGEDMLNRPIIAMETLRQTGLRLIPYRAVGQSSGMLLALRVDEVTLDGVQAGKVIAFAPQILGNGEGYQALTGGVL